MYGVFSQNIRCIFQMLQGSFVEFVLYFSIYSENIPMYSENKICDNLCRIRGALSGLFVFYIGLFGGHFSEDEICDDAGIYAKVG